MLTKMTKPSGDSPEYIKDINANTSVKRFLGTFFLLIVLTFIVTLAAL
jgi:hypothetical protein